MITYARTVGVAPATTTLNVRSGLGINCPPDVTTIAEYNPPPTPPPPQPTAPPEIQLPKDLPDKVKQDTVAAVNKAWQSGQCSYVAPQAITTAVVPAGIKATFYRAYGDDIALKGGGGGLGYVFDRPEINRSLPPNGKYLPGYTDDCAARGYYSDSCSSKEGFGAIPTDFELGRDRCYTPVHSAWTTASLADAAGDAQLDALKKFQRWTLAIQVLSVLGMATLATAAVYRAIKDYKKP